MWHLFTGHLKGNSSAKRGNKGTLTGEHVSSNNEVTVGPQDPQVLPTWIKNIPKKKFQKAPKSKTWTCCVIYIAFTVMWTIFLKVFTEFITILLLLFMFFEVVFGPRGMWDLGSPTRDRTCTPCTGRQSLNHWTTREVYMAFTLYQTL